MCTYGLGAKMQGVCDFGMGPASADVLKHFLLTRCERRGLIGVASLDKVPITGCKHTPAIRHDTYSCKNVGSGKSLG
jgi:hypothetical protein